MAKRGYKLQEFVAHTGNVNCLRIGKKTCRQFLTGGDDHVVNLWTVGKPEPLMRGRTSHNRLSDFLVQIIKTCVRVDVQSLNGHSSPIESVAFDSAEVLAVAGASSGVIKLWDLEETKVIHNLTGHRSYCTAVEFHPFGEFLASGSMDTNLKIWDIRKKGCTHTYKGHSRGISTMKFTPDGRWVVSGGLDHVVKVWDLTAGKLLHDFKLHEGHIRSLEFHPFEFLLATGSADRTVKFWDLETFEMISSTRHETSGVRSMKFHPDGRSLLCALDDSLKVYSWEPLICHDSVNMGWSTIGDLCTHDGKLLGGAYYVNSVGIWVVDMSVVQLSGGSIVPEQNGQSEEKVELQNIALVKSENHRMLTSNARCTSPDSESKDIKNIYVDSESPVSSNKIGSLRSPKVMAPPESMEIKSLPSPKQDSGAVLHAKPNEFASKRSFVVPILVSSDCHDPKHMAGTKTDSVSTARINAGTLLRPAITRKTPNIKIDSEAVSTIPDSVSFGSNAPTTLLQPANRREASATNSDAETISAAPVLGSFRNTVDSKRGALIHVRKPSSNKPELETVSIAHQYSPRAEDNATNAKKAHVRTPPSTTKFMTETMPIAPESGSFGTVSTFDSTVDQNCKNRLMPDNNARDSSQKQDFSIKTVDEKMGELSPLTQSNLGNDGHAQNDVRGVNPVKVVNGVAVVHGRTRNLVERFEKIEIFNYFEARLPETTPQIVRSVETAPTAPQLLISAERMPTTRVSDQSFAGREEDPALNDNHVVQILMQNHDALISTFMSRLAKLQMVRHLWERNDVKGAINAMKKLPDHSVQSDVISVLVEKVEVITLDLFSCLLPVLLDLLDAKIERHTSVSLEMLLKLVVVFGHLVLSTVSALPGVGVDLHAEQRLKSCKECFVCLQNLQKILPTLIRRGGVLGRYALELNLLLQQS